MGSTKDPLDGQAVAKACYVRLEARKCCCEALIDETPFAALPSCCRVPLVSFRAR